MTNFPFYIIILLYHVLKKVVLFIVAHPNVTGTRARNIEYRAMEKIRRTPWGIKKAEELYIEKANGGMYSIDKAIDTINFGYKYLV